MPPAQVKAQLSARPNRPALTPEEQMTHRMNQKSDTQQSHDGLQHEMCSFVASTANCQSTVKLMLLQAIGEMRGVVFVRAAAAIFP